MPAFSTFARSLPIPLLQRYFASIDIELPSRIVWAGDRTQVARELTRQQPAWPTGLRSQIDSDVERVWGLVNEVGQTALYGSAESAAQLDAIESSAARAMFVFLEDKEWFRRAEAIRYADERRHGRIWDAFIGEPTLEVLQDDFAVETLVSAIKARFETPRVHIDIHNRSRPKLDSAPLSLIQADIYREDRQDEEWAFNGDDLTRRAHRGVLEAAITYEPATGLIEVVSRDRETRIEFARLFSECLLHSAFRAERARVRLFDLMPLRSRMEFLTDPEDGIESVRVVMLRLNPYDRVGDRVTIEVPRASQDDIWTMADRNFGLRNPLNGGWGITQARMIIRFRRDASGRPARSLPVMISLPSGCDLKERTDDERIVGERYLRRWGIFREV